MYILKLIRYKNLLIIAYTMIVMRYGIIAPLAYYLGQYSEPPLQFVLQFPLLGFIILVISTILIAAAGYVLNDANDLEIDSINKPHKQIIGVKISFNNAMLIYFIINLAGILGGFIAAYIVRLPVLGFLFAITSGFLWFYSTTYKQQAITGNIIISLLTAVVPLLSYLFELRALNLVYHNYLLAIGNDFGFIGSWILWYAVFAFIITLAREITKDIEDFEGDAAYGRSTIPIRYGASVSKIIIYILSSIVALLLILLYFLYLKDIYTLIYFLLFIISPLILSNIIVFKTKTIKGLKQAGNILKLVMVAGITYGILIRYLIQLNIE